jgi:hypothetical protein
VGNAGKVGMPGNVDTAGIATIDANPGTVDISGIDENTGNGGIKDIPTFFEVCLKGVASRFFALGGGEGEGEGEGWKLFVCSGVREKLRALTSSGWGSVGEGGLGRFCCCCCFCNAGRHRSQFPQGSWGQQLPCIENVGVGDFRNVGVGDFRNVGVGDFRNVGVGDFRNVGVGDFRNVGVGDFRGGEDEGAGVDVEPEKFGYFLNELVGSIFTTLNMISILFTD